MATPGITLCMISRDEAGCIGDAIRSVAGVAEDIVVVDTGSTDGTPELAASLGARVFHQPWEDSFSKPRNFGFDQVRTKWVMVLDCDEKLQAQSRPLVIDACRSNVGDGFTVNVMVHSPTGVSPTRMLRIGRADKGFRFRNRIHERIDVDMSKHTVIATPIVIDHFGYLYKPRQVKAELYNRLLQLDVEDRPTDNYLLINLSHNCWCARDPRWQEYLPRAIATLPRDAENPPHALVTALFEIIFSLPPQDEPSTMTFAQADDLAARWLPTSLPVLSARAKWRFRNGREQEGREMAATALALWQAKTFRSDIAFKPGPLLAEMQRMAQQPISPRPAPQ
jgi:hypothetical protein